MRKGSNITKKSDLYYIELSNIYSLSAELLDHPSPPDEPNSKESTFKFKVAKRCQRKVKNKLEKYLSTNNDDSLIDLYIDKAEDEHIVMAKNGIKV